jgi:hypothetical protein
MSGEDLGRALAAMPLDGQITFEPWKKYVFGKLRR